MTSKILFIILMSAFFLVPLLLYNSRKRFMARFYLRMTALAAARKLYRLMLLILRDRGIKDPNEGLAEPRFRTVVNFIFGGSRDRMTELAFGDHKVDLTQGADTCITSVGHPSGRAESKGSHLYGQ